MGVGGACIGKGGINAGVGVKVGDDMLLESPVFGQTSKRAVRLKNTPFDLTIPRCSKSVDSAPAPLLIQLKL